MSTEYGVIEIMKKFNLETPGDAWDLIIEKELDGEWEARKPEGQPWIITIPEEDD